MNLLLAENKIQALKTWIAHHVSPAMGTEWHPFGFAPFPKLPTWLPLQGLMAIIVTVLVLVIYGVVVKKQLKPQGRLTNFFESFVLYVRNEIVIPNMGETEGKKWTPFFLSVDLLRLCFFQG